MGSRRCLEPQRRPRQSSRVVPDADVTCRYHATETAIKLASGPPAAPDLATHGFFLEDQRRVPGQAQRREDPMLRSGLLFAGANARRASDDDGVLTALEARP